MTEHCDCLVIGAGPAGLTAALYLGRYMRRTIVVDNDQSRAAWIPASHNYPGFDAIAGPAILGRLRRQLEPYNCVLQRNDEILSIRKTNTGFEAIGKLRSYFAFRIFLATGMVDSKPAVPGLVELIRAGHIRFCPICDAYEAIDRRIGVVLEDEDNWGKALFLRTYSREVTLMKLGADLDLSRLPVDELKRAGVKYEQCAVMRLEIVEGGTTVLLADGSSATFDVIYPFLGCAIRSSLAITLGAGHDEFGCVTVNGRQETSVRGLFAGGDVVSDLHQISVAIGHAAVAATAIHNTLPPALR